jgi:hypothetical protein
MPMIISNGPESITVNRHPQVESFQNDRSYFWKGFTCLYCKHQYISNPRASEKENDDHFREQEKDHFYLICNPKPMSPNVYVCTKRPNIEQIKIESKQETYVVKTKPLVY